MDSSKRNAQLEPGQFLGAVLLELVLPVNQPLQHVIWLLIVAHLVAGGNNGAHELVSLQQALVELLDFGQAVPHKRTHPRAHLVQGAAGFHELEGVVDGGVQVFLRAAELGADEDAAGHEGDDAEELLVDVDGGPVGAGGKFPEDGFLDLIGDGGVEAHQGGGQVGLDGVGNDLLAGLELGVPGVHELRDGVVEADGVVGELSELGEEFGRDGDDGEFLGCVSGGVYF